MERLSGKTPDQERFKEQAQLRNQNRTFTDKLLGRNKIHPTDIARDEAEVVNGLVDARMRLMSQSEASELSHQSVADEVLESGEFNKSINAVKVEEMLRVEHPEILSAIEYVQVDGTLNLLESLIETKGDEEADTIVFAVQELLQAKVDSMIRSHDTFGLRSFIELNHPESLAKAQLTPFFLKMPDDVIFNPAYAMRISNAITYTTLLGIHSDRVTLLEDQIALHDSLSALNIKVRKNAGLE